MTTTKPPCDQPLGDAATIGALVKLPLVSVIVINYNYGRFLDEAIESVYAQTYREIECIVVDNASTDETPDVLAALAARHDDLVILHRAANDGQSPASLDGLARARGHYVIFLDADDFLLPHCIETHIYVHLSMRVHVGFTSGDMLQIVGREIVVANGEAAGRVIRSGRHRRPKLIKPYRSKPGWPSASVSEDMTSKVHYIPPLRAHWIWSPTSGLCYRRDALALFADNARLGELRTGTDLYFAFGCSGLSGSVIIDEPLFAYRIHGGNIFTSRAQLDRTLNFTLGSSGDSNVKAQLFLVDHLVAKAARFAPNLALKANLLALLFRVDRRDPDPTLPRWARRSRAAQAIVRDYARFSSSMGGPRRTRFFLMVLARSFASPRRLLASLPRQPT